MAKKTEEDIDEDFIIASMNMTGPSGLNKVKPSVKLKEVENISESEEELQPVVPASKEEKEPRKRKSKGDYETLFIRPSDITGRQGKTVYLREKYYKRINKIIRLYHNPKLSVFSYVDAVLEYHLDFYKQDIKEIHDKLYIPPHEE